MIEEESEVKWGHWGLELEMIFWDILSECRIITNSAEATDATDVNNILFVRAAHSGVTIGSSLLTLTTVTNSLLILF